jgi:hypothetical protein
LTRIELILQTRATFALVVVIVIIIVGSGCSGPLLLVDASIFVLDLGNGFLANGLGFIRGERGSAVRTCVTTLSDAFVTGGVEVGVT